MDLGYWLMYPLTHEEHLVLKRAVCMLARGDVSPYDRFTIAYLIARECLSFDGERVHVTDKGKEAIKFFGRSRDR